MSESLRDSVAINPQLVLLREQYQNEGLIIVKESAGCVMERTEDGITNARFGTLHDGKLTYDDYEFYANFKPRVFDEATTKASNPTNFFYMITYYDPYSYEPSLGFHFREFEPLSPAQAERAKQAGREAFRLLTE